LHTQPKLRLGVESGKILNKAPSLKQFILEGLPVIIVLFLIICEKIVNLTVPEMFGKSSTYHFR